MNVSNNSKLSVTMDDDLPDKESSLLCTQKALIDSDFNNAFCIYKKLLSDYPDDQEVHLGVLKAKYHEADTGSLFELFLHVFEEEKTKVNEL